MAAGTRDSIDEKLAQMYASKVTVNLDSKSTLSPEDFWNSMNLMAVNYKAMINYKCK